MAITKQRGEPVTCAWVVAAVVFVISLAGAVRVAHGNGDVEERRIATAFLDLRMRVHRGLVDVLQFGGDIVALGDGYLLAARTGELYSFGWAPDGETLRFDGLPYPVPLNLDEFKKSAGNGANHVWFRVAGLAVQEIGDRLRLFVSHHRWKRDEACSVVRISTIEGERDVVLGGGPGLTWRTLFETRPCLPIQHGNRGHPFQGNHVGGRLALMNERQLLFSVGDHGFDGWDAEPSFPQDESTSYGKTLLIDIESGAAEVFSRGHRNPQGLYIDRDGAIWLTEHGPKGGDELNRIRRGANYGWPLVTYGTTYGSQHWPLSEQQGGHDGYEQPYHSWTPSIAVSSLIRVRDHSFPPWRDDLLVSSLNDMSIWRLRVREERIVYLERIPIGHRIRDIAQGNDGRIVLWTDEGALISLEPARSP